MKVHVAVKHSSFKFFDFVAIQSFNDNNCHCEEAIEYTKILWKLFKLWNIIHMENTNGNYQNVKSKSEEQRTHTYQRYHKDKCLY